MIPIDESLRLGRIAQLWRELVDAADAGDARARAFLALFAPWVRDQLRVQARS